MNETQPLVSFRAQALPGHIDSAGNEVDYIYDDVGNIVRIDRVTVPTTGALAILNFTLQ